MSCFVIKIMSECRVEDVKEYVHLERVLDLVKIDVELNAMSVYIYNNHWNTLLFLSHTDY